MAMTSDQCPPKLTYFNFKGRAQPLRWALRVLNVDFVDNIISPEWFRNEVAEKSPNGCVPILEFRGESYTDTLCIMRFIASQLVPDNTSLMPETELDDLHAVAAFCLADLLVDSALRVDRFSTDERKAEALKNLEEVQLPSMLTMLDRHIAVHQDVLGHIVSHKLTYADLYVAGQLVETLSQKWFTIQDLDALIPHGLQTLKMVMSIPAIKKFEYEFDFRGPVLSYFNKPNRAEAIRLCFKIGEVSFQDRLISESEWKELKDKVSPTSELPLIEFDDKFHAVESEAILKWVGERTGLAPVTWRGRARADCLFSRFQPITFLWRQIKEASDAEAARERVIKEILPKSLQVIDGLIPSTATWSADVKLTWIDLYLASQWKLLLIREYISNEKDQAQYPQLHRIYRQVYDLPLVKDYLE